LAECCLAGGKGAEVQLGSREQGVGSREELTPNPQSSRFDTLLFAEGGARILVSVSPENQQVWESHLQTQLGEHWQRLGQVGAAGGKLRISLGDNQSLIDATIEEISDRWLNAIERRL
jgi:phosphoribosylformylglycinamidine synthase